MVALFPAVVVAEDIPFTTEIAVPRVGAEPLLPDITKVSAASPVPIANAQLDALPAAVTLGTDVVEGVTDVVKEVLAPRTSSPLPLLNDTLLL